MDINQLFPLFAALVGFPAIVAAGINTAKYFGLLTDGQAPAVVFWVNLVGFVGVGVAYFTGNLPLLSQIDSQLGSVSAFLLSFVAFVSQLKGANAYHAALRGSPVIGKSFTKSYG
jgi:hypothetical protein